MNGTATEPRIDPRDERVDVSAKFALQRMLQRSDMRADGVRLIEGVNSGQLAGIFGDDLLTAAQLAQRLGTQRWLLVPKGEDVALVLDPANPMTAPSTIIFRRPTQVKMPETMLTPGVPLTQVRSNKGAFGVLDPVTGQMILTRTPPPDRLDAALQKASQAFELWRSGRLGNCGAGGSAVSNVVPPVCVSTPPAESIGAIKLGSNGITGAPGLANKAVTVGSGGSRSGAGGGGGSGGPSGPGSGVQQTGIAQVNTASTDWIAANAAASTTTSINLFLKANGEPVPGDSTHTSLGRENSIECLYYEQAVSTPTNAATGQASGKRQYRAIIIGKRLDKSSPLLAKALTQNQVVEATIKFYRPHPVGDGKTEQFYTVEITQGRIASLKQVTAPKSSGAGPGAMVEEVAIVFSSITWTWTNGGISHQDAWSAQS